MSRVFSLLLLGFVLAGCSGETTALGVPVYPGATKSDSAGLAAQMGAKGLEVAAFKTKDDQSKVAEFYKGKFSKIKPMEMSFGGDALSVFRSEDANTRTVIIVSRKKSDSETSIEIASGKQDEK